MHDWQKLIVPLILVTFWGLKQVFEREPQRPPGPRPTPPGPRPDFTPLSPRAGEPPARREPSLRWPDASSATVRRADDEIIVIRPDSLLPEPPPRASSSSRRNSRPKARRAEPERSRPLLTGVSQSIGPLLDRSIPLGTAPLSAPSSPSSTSAPRTSGAEANAIAHALRSPERLREALLINEILQPPLALRRPRRS